MNKKPQGYRKKILRLLRIFAQHFLPKWISRAMISIYGNFTTRTISYSRYGEDLLIKSFFESIKLSKGVYCDIGCFHPFWGSNTYLLHKLGWSGICVDLDEFKLQAMKTWRGKRVKCVLAAITGKVRRGSLAKAYRFQNRLWSDIDTLDQHTADAYEAAGAGRYKEEVLVTMEINTLLNKHPGIDCICIDIEGLDQEVVLGIDFSVHRPRLIVFEDNINWGGSDRLKEYLASAHYERLFVSGGSVAYIDKTVTVAQRLDAS